MKRIALLVILLAAGSVTLRGQALPSANGRQFTIVAGGFGSVFQPDYEGQWTVQSPYNPVAQSSSYPLVGLGAFVDVKLNRWAQVEAEGRWLRFNQNMGITQDHYLIGPRVSVYQFRRSTIYAKALGGFAKMHFDDFGSHGTFTDVALGGGVDMMLTRKLSFRAIDAEYQYWPQWGNRHVSPYGVSMGFSYKVF